MRNLLLDEHHPLKNRTLYISNMLKEPQKPYIDKQKPDIAQIFTAKTAGHISRMREAFSDGTIFGRADMMKVTGLGPSRASELLQELTAHGIIETVSGYGKGKYRFRC